MSARQQTILIVDDSPDDIAMLIMLPAADASMLRIRP